MMIYKKPINFLESENPQKPSRLHIRRIIFFAIITLLIVGIAGCGAAAYFYADSSHDPKAYDPITLEPKTPNGIFRRISNLVFASKEYALQGQEQDRINILLLGQGGPGHDGPYLTDTIIIASIKPSTGQVAMITIPRDMSVYVPEHGTYKVNHVNAFGEAEKKYYGPVLTAQVLSDVFNIPIHYYVRVDFAAFEDAIDIVDGVRVTVDRSFTDYQYPAPNYLYQTVSFKAGPQTMDGKTALTFVRSRHGNNGEGSDFARSKRQQKVILALKEKVLSFQTLSNPMKINSMLTSLQEHVATNMEFADIIAFLKLAKTAQTDSIIIFNLDDGPHGYLQSTIGNNGAYLLVPKVGDFTDINTRVSTIFENPPEIAENNTPPQEAPKIDYTGANIEIQNGTWRAGMAARIRQRLTNNKFAITQVANTEHRPIAQSGIYIIRNTPSTQEVVQGLKNNLNLPIRQYDDATEKPIDKETDILVILGEDFEE